MLDGARKPKSKTTDVRLSFCVTEKEAKQIKRLATHDGRTLSSFVRLAVKSYADLQ